MQIRRIEYNKKQINTINSFFFNIENIMKRKTFKQYYNELKNEMKIYIFHF